MNDFVQEGQLQRVSFWGVSLWKALNKYHLRYSDLI